MAPSKRHIRRATYPPWVAHNVGAQSTTGVRLRVFDFLHSAVWVDVGRFPSGYGSPAEGKLWHWLLFCSNYNQSWDGYLDGFLDAFASGVRAFWRGSIGFPRFPKPGTTYDLRTWLDTRLVCSQAYYGAYEGATAHDVRAALRITRERRARVMRDGRFPSGPDDLEFASRRAELFASVHGTIERRAKFAPWANGNSTVVSLVPIVPGAERAVRARIALVKRNRAFTEVPGVHFARFAVIDRAVAGVHPRIGPMLRNSWLLFAADFDGHFDGRRGRRPVVELAEARRLFDAIGAVDELRSVWSPCYRYDMSGAFGAYLVPSVVEPLALYRDYPSSTLNEVIAALVTRQHVIDQLQAAPPP